MPPQGQRLLSIQPLLQHFKNRCKHTIFPPMHWRSTSYSCQVLIRRSQLRKVKILTCLSGLETAACCVCRSRISKHKLNKVNSWNLPVICLLCPAVENGQVERQCWPCILKIDNVNNQITSCANCFCWNHFSRICRKTILGATLACALKVLCDHFIYLSDYDNRYQVFTLTLCDLEQVMIFLWACVKRCKDGMESIFH